MPSNVENILGAILTGDGSGIQKPASRVEELLFEIYEQGGGGGGDSVIGGIKLTIDSDFVMTATLVDKNGEEYGVSDDIDLPLEEMVVDAEYDPLTQKIKLELKNGNYVEFSVAELVSGLQTELSSSNKLNPAYIAYDASHRAVSDTEKNTWNAKQNAISDLETIRSGAAAGATAVQPSTMETALNAKQDTISDLAAIRSGASAGATAVQPATMSEALAAKQNSLSETQLAAVNSGINSTKVGQIETNKSNILLLESMNGAKNRLNNIAGTYSESGLTFTVNPDKSVTVTGSLAAGSTRVAYIINTYTIEDGDFLSGCPSGGGDDTYELAAFSATSSVSKRDYGSGVDLTSDAGKQCDIIIIIRPGQNNLNVTFKPMICNKEELDAFPAFTQYALPNTVIAPTLIEQVDGGAKNLVNQPDVTQSSSGYMARVVASVLQPGTYICSYTVTAAAVCDLAVAFKGSDDDDSVGYYGQSIKAGTSRYFGVLEITKTSTYYNIYCNAAASMSNFMICTLADWKVSNKHVPYQWETTDITNQYAGSSTWNYFDKDNTTCKLYRNPQTHCCIATINTITKAEFPINVSVAIGSNQILTTYRPKATASVVMFFENSLLVLSKNSINEALALTALTSPVPSGTAIEMQLEWHYI